ncbi:MAG TPA: PKD domain-containing protein, partial [Bacteroidia bacterium]|nr:PKD domain-containing protein [Bacteroidia bacterium]
GAKVSATADGGFLLLHYAPNGQLEFQKYDSNAVFQYGHSFPAHASYNSAQRHGKVFSVMDGPHEDTLYVQKINMATGAVEAYRRVAGPQNGTIGYFSNGNHFAIATQDSGFLVVLTKWQCYNLAFCDVCQLKLDKNLNYQFFTAGNFLYNQQMLSRKVVEHSDGSIWHVTTVDNAPFGYSTSIVRFNGQTGVQINSTTVRSTAGPPSIGGVTELPGRVVISGLAGQYGYAMSISPDLATVHWLKTYSVPLNYAGAYELTAGPGGNLYGHMGDKVICLRPDGTVVWCMDADNAANVVPRVRLGTHKMAAIYNPNGAGLKASVIDSNGLGFCNPVPYAVTTTAYTHTFHSLPLSNIIGFGFQYSFLPNPPSSPLNVNPTLVCSAVCNFTASFTATTNALQMSLSPLPAGLSSYQWNFGDGNTSTVMNPNHTYSAPGTYTVCLIGTSLCMSDTICQQVTVTCQPTTAAFSTTVNQQTATFTNGSSGGGNLLYSWNFGDGGTSTLTNPVHVYSSPGYYTVCLIAMGPCGNDTTCRVVNAGCGMTTAAFTASTNQLTAQFMNGSTGQGAISYHWDFGDGAISTGISPSHTYLAPGSYTVCLRITTPCGADSTCGQVTVACPPLMAAMSSSGTALSVQFTDLTAGTPIGWTWDFGDGGSSTQQNPSHAYASPGTYAVCLIVEDGCSADTTCGQVTVVCPPLTAAMSNTGAFPLIQFTDLTAGAPIGWTWDFGDGGSSNLQNPSHTYAAPGNYMVCLMVDDGCSTDTTCKTVDVSVGMDSPGSMAVEVSPNPTSAQAWLRWTATMDGSATLKVATADGRQWWVADGLVSPYRMDVSAWPQGMYFLELTAGSVHVVRRFVVQR